MNNFTPMKREHWGELSDGSNLKKELKSSDICRTGQKLDKLKQLQTLKSESKELFVTLDNPLVTQTVEVMNQTESIRSLIDTYTTHNSGNPSQVMPAIDFPPAPTLNLVRNDKFRKPFWYLPPKSTPFSRGVPQTTSKIDKTIAMEAMRKSLAGLLRLKGFAECTDSAIEMFTDSLDEFYMSFMERINDVLTNEGRDQVKQLDVNLLERSYFEMGHSSLLSLHNYYKNEVVARNRSEQREFKDMFQEYEKLMHESQHLQKNNDYITLMEFTGAPGGSGTGMQHEGVNIMNFLDGENANTGFKDIFDQSNLIESTTTADESLSLSVGPASITSTE